MCRPRETRFASAQGGRFCYTYHEILIFSYPGGWMSRPRETRFASAQGGRFCYTCNEILTLSYPGVGGCLGPGRRALPQLREANSATRVTKY